MTGVDPQIARVLARMPAAARPEMDVIEARRASRERAQVLRRDVEAVDRVFDRRVRTRAGDVAVRIYAPAGPSLPLLVFLHGGGWVVGDLDGPDALCRTLADRAHCMVVSVDYPLAPEHKFPAALEASYGVVGWVRDAAHEIGADPQRIAVGGESAGANLAAAIAQVSRDRGGPALCLQLLVTPALDHAFDTASYLENAEGYGLTRREMMWWWSQYLARDLDGGDPYASPLRATDLRGLPPALVVTAQFDPLRDEGREYACRLRAAGVPVDHRNYESAVHGFLSMASEVDMARAAVEEIAGAVREGLAPRSTSAPR
ncbi:MAG: alpha/beta hydrolase [Chloroflexota bacterium]|nr:alpha/beta hydrolase [Chloroflexota bacterium]